MSQTIEDIDIDITVFPALLWQYSNAQNIYDLLLNKNLWYLQYYTGFWLNWIFDVFDLREANLFGLTIWSIILDFPLYVNLEPLDPDAPLWGFNEYTLPPPPSPLINTYVNFTHGNLAPSSASNLTESDQRIALQLRYYQLVTRGAVGADTLNPLNVNVFLNYIFGDLGGVWMIDNLDMTITYEFNYTPSQNLYAVIIEHNLLPKPAGVAISYILPP